MGVIHLPRLDGPGSPDIEAILQRAESDARAYQQAGFDALLVENYGDHPYPKDRSAPHVAAIMTRACARVRRATSLPVGVNVLRNDARSALAVALAAGGDFIRCNVLTGAVVADQGLIEGCAHELDQYRQHLGPAAPRILVAADVHVKHAQSLSQRPIEQEAHDAVTRGGADVVLVTGAATGAPADLDDVRRIRSTVNVPVWVASGVTAETLAETLDVAQGVIVGSAAKSKGDARNEVDAQRARSLAEAAGKSPARA